MSGGGDTQEPRRPVPVIAVDGPAASGKGTIAADVARTLGFHLLDSGALYRLVALKAEQARVPLDVEAGVAEIARRLDASFDAGRVVLEGIDVTDAIRAAGVSAAASRVAVHPAVRAALVDRQRAFRQPPGLVADGRDMGTVVFPDAELKVFVTASPEERARRRHKQLIEKGISNTIQSLLREIRERDARDAGRAVAPLIAAQDAVILDTTDMPAEAAARFVLDRYGERAASRAGSRRGSGRR